MKNIIQNIPKYKIKLVSALLIGLIFILSSNLYGQTTLIDPLVEGGFENATSTLAANGWTAVNTTSIAWFVGTAAGSQSGTKAAFVGSDASTYVGSSAAVVKHFYRDVVIPVGATQVYLNYCLKMPIIDNTYDYFYIYTTTTANTPVSGTIPGAGYTQRIAYTTPALAVFTAMPQIDLTALAGTTVRLVFTYKTDAASPYANPAVDNISLTYVPGCTTPANPANPTAGSFGCNVTLTATGSAPVGETWYWQGTSCGTSTAMGSAPATYSAPTTNTYYIRSQTNVGGCWSAGCGSVVVNALDAPIIITNPVSASTGCNGTPVSFSVEATGAGLTYQWQRNGVDISGGVYSGETTEVLTISDPTGLTGSLYRCVVTGTCGTATSTASTLTVLGAGLSGVRTVGTLGNYATLKLAFDAINANGLTGDLDLQIISSISDNNEAILNSWANCGTVNYNLKIYPTGIGPWTLSGSNITSLVTLNGADYVTFDGRLNQVGAANNLIISNTDLTFVGSTIKFIADACYNTIKYCTIKGVENTYTSGVIFFSTATTTGNNFNTISYCDIRDGATTPANGIYASGTAGKENSDNIVTNCNLYNMFKGAGGYGSGVDLESGNSRWTFTGNSFYQTVARVDGSLWPLYINCPLSNEFIITDNYVGGTAPLCGGGQLDMSFSANYVSFSGISLTCSTTGISNIENNTIRNIHLTCVPYENLGVIYTRFAAISTTGRIDVIGNTIGDASTGSILITMQDNGTQRGGITAIIKGGDGMVLNNAIGSITINGTIGDQCLFNGIQITGSLINDMIISGNTLGHSTTANSIQSTSVAPIPPITFGGIYFGTAGSYITTVSNNLIANITLNNTGTIPFCLGLSNQGTGGTQTVTGNTVRNITTQCTNTTSATMPALAGIINNNSTTGGLTISQNTIHSLSATGAALVKVYGIYGKNAVAGTNTISNNLIYSIITSATGSWMTGVYISQGTALITNNMIRLGINSSGASVNTDAPIMGIWSASASAVNIFFNSVYIGGNAGAGTNYTYGFVRSVTAVNDCRNNIFYNARIGGSRNFAICINTITTFTGNYNNLFTVVAGANLGTYNYPTCTPRTYAAWQTGVPADANSINVDPSFIAPVAATPDLHINVGSPTIGIGVAGTGILTDYDNQVRKTGAGFPNGPTIGADEVITTPLGANAYGIYSPDVLGGEVEDCEILATGGSPGGQGIKVADNIDNHWANVGISGYQVITTDNISCMNTDITFNTATVAPNWLFGNGSNPTSGAIKPIEVQYTSVGRKNIIETVKLYKDFVNITMDVPDPGAILGAPSGAGCPTTYSYTSSVAGSDGFTYLWSATVPGGCSTTIATPTLATTNVTFVNLTGVNQIFILTLQITTECCGPLRTVTRYLTIYPSPNSPTVLGSPFSLCTGGSQGFSVNAPNAAYSYEWYDLSTGGTLLGSGTSYTANPVLTGATSYWVQATNSYGCSSARTQVIVNGNDTPPPAISGASTCGAGDVTLAITAPVAGYTYNWYTGSCGGTLVQSSTSTSYTTTIVATTTFYVSAVPPLCGPSACTAVAATYIVPPNPIVWLGAVAGVNNWFNTANWTSGCLPTCNTNVSIPNLAIDPDIGFNATANAACKDINLQAGAILSFSDTKAELDICGNMTHSGIVTTGGVGLVKFMGTTSQTYVRAGSGDFHNVTIDNTAATPTLTLSNNLILDASGVFDFVNGRLVTGANRLEVLNNNATAITGHAAGRYVEGNLRRYFASNLLTYAFPVGTSTDYYLAEIENNNLIGITYFDAKFVTPFTNTGGLNPATAIDAGTLYASISGIWQIDPNAVPSGGTYNIKLWFNGGNAGGNLFGVVDNSFGPLKRPSASTLAWDWTAIGGSLNGAGTIGRTIAGGYAKRSNWTTFSHFGIGKSVTPLPIELISFEAICNNKTVDLKWSTSIEINNDYFTIEKSSDGVNFSTLISIKGAGNSNSLLNYYFTDENPFEGISFYRLKQTDFDGKYKYSQIIVSCNGSLNNKPVNISVRPNPSNSGESVFVDISGFKDKEILVIVVNSLGEQLFSKVVLTDVNDFTFEAIDPHSRLAPGVYYIIGSSNSNLFNKKVIIL